MQIICAQDSRRSDWNEKIPYYTKLRGYPFKGGLIKSDLIKSFLGKKSILSDTN